MSGAPPHARQCPLFFEAVDGVFLPVEKKNQTQGAVNEVTEIGCVPFEWLVFFFHYFTDFCCLVLWACAVPNPISFIGSLMVQLGSTLFLFDSIAYFSLVWRSICCFSFISSYFFAKFCGSSVATNEMIHFFSSRKLFQMKDECFRFVDRVMLWHWRTIRLVSAWSGGKSRTKVGGDLSDDTLTWPNTSIQRLWTDNFCMIFFFTSFF